MNHFTAHSYDIIFMDIFMDGMDGVETAEQIRKFDSHVILIFLTSSQDHMKNAFSCHAFDYVEKPVDLEQITNCLLDALKIIPNKDQFFSFLYNNLEKTGGIFSDHIFPAFITLFAFQFLHTGLVCTLHSLL